MSFSKDLVIVFKQSAKNSLGLNYGVPQGPLLTYVLGAWFMEQNITLTALASKYSALFGLEISKSHDFYGPFNSEEELNKFSYLLAEELQAEKVNLIPMELFSSSIEDSISIEDLWSKLKNSSEVMENIEIKQEPSGLLHKLLSKNK